MGVFCIHYFSVGLSNNSKNDNFATAPKEKSQISSVTSSLANSFVETSLCIINGHYGVGQMFN